MARPKRKIPWIDLRGEVYYVFWYNEKSKRTDKLSLGTTDAAEAQNRYAAFLAEGKAAFTPGPDGLTVSAALDSYFFEHIKPKAAAPRTVENSINNLKTFFGEKPLKDIGVPECRAYADARVAGDIGEGVAMPSTIGKELTSLKAAARHAIKWKRLSLADMPTFEIPRGARTKGIWLFKDELQRLFDAAKALDEANGDAMGRMLSFVELLYYTGSRRRAVETLTWPQVDLFRRRISLAQHGERATNKRRPTIPADPLLMPTLQRCFKHKKNDYVLGSKVIMTYAFDTIATKAKLTSLPGRDGRPPSKSLTPHMLRHSRATHLLQDGKSPWAVANLLGDTVQTVVSIYGHHSAGYLEDELYGKKADILDELTG